MKLLKIGEVAEKAGVSVQTVRYYEREGLIREPMRSRSNGYRKFEPLVVYQIQFIKNAQELGYDLDEIRDLLSLLEGKPEDKEAFTESIQEKIDRLEAIKTVLESLTPTDAPWHHDIDYPEPEQIEPEGPLKSFLQPLS
jgi:MerR family copper efflux transcriptional regulator